MRRSSVLFRRVELRNQTRKLKITRPCRRDDSDETRKDGFVVSLCLCLQETRTPLPNFYVIRDGFQFQWLVGRTAGVTLCSHPVQSFILIVCPNTVDGIRSTYLSCPSVLSNLTGAGEARSTAFARS